MSIPGREYFERIRSSKNFLASLFFGIVAGGILTLLLGYSTDLIMGSIEALLFLVGSFFVLTYVALRFSQASEKILTRYIISVDPMSFDSLCSTTLKQIPDGLAGRKEVEDILQNIKTTFNDSLRLEAMNVNTIRRYSEELLKSIQKTKDHTIKLMLSKIQETMSNFENLEKHLVEAAHKNTSVFKTQKYEIQNLEKGISLKKGFFSREILRLYFESYIENTLLYPIHCQTEIAPFLNIKEYTELLQNVKAFFNSISSERTFLELGIRFNLVEDVRYWRRLRSDFYKPLIEEMKDSFERLSIDILAIQKEK